jgi:hypothetical protein
VRGTVEAPPPSKQKSTMKVKPARKRILPLGAIIGAAALAMLLIPVAQASAAPPTLSVNITGSGAGEVTGGPGEPSEIACSYASPGPQTGVCSTSMVYIEEFETFVMLLARTPAEGSEFTGAWSREGGTPLGGCGPASSECIVAAEEGEEVKIGVEFTAAPNPPTLSVNLKGSGTGEVTGEPGEPNIECFYASPGPQSGTCSTSMVYIEEFETFVMLLARTPAEGSESTGAWSREGGTPLGGCGPASSECIVAAEEGEEVKIGVEFTEIVPPPSNLKVNVEEGEGTVVSNPAGISCGSECEEAFEEGGKVTLTASPAPGYLFKSWKKCDTGGVNGRQCTITATSSLKEVGAKFVKVWSLSASKAGSGIGKVQTSPGGILCLYNCSEAEAVFKEGSVTVKQAAAKHNHFVQWLGDCSGSEPTCSVSMTEAHSVEAEFAPDTQYTLSFSKEGGGQGSVKSKPSGLLCGYTCNSQVASFYSGEEVLITYKLNKGTTKLEWTTGAGTCTGSTEALEGTCTVPMSSAKELVAKFS